VSAAPPAAVRGRVVRVSRKPETPGQRGLPKVAVPSARITFAGLEGDFNVYRHEVSSDDPNMAILVVPIEMIEVLQREGWPVRPGDLGENLTTGGIPYEDFRPGRRYAVGGALLEVSKPCPPCDNLYLLPYVSAAKGPEFLKVMLDRRGWYARVLREGLVRTNDPVERVGD
jgi:MOSC domain-containing protein YiiM